MSFAVQQTSLDAFSSVIDGLSSRQEAVFRVLSERGPVNNRELAELLGWPINSVTPRVLELREQGLVLEHEVLRDPVTGRSASQWVVAPVGGSYHES